MFYTMNKYIAYYRVSTDKQGKSGLGLEAQQQAVAQFLAGRGELLAEFTEVESGKRHTNRPQLAEALALCRKHKARLVIAKLDRLARNVHFISGLMESGVDFVAVDMPEANRLTVHIIAAVAEHEREMISQRTKAALAAARARGTRLGNPTPLPSLEKGRATARNYLEGHHRRVQPVITALHGQNLSLRAIASEMNRRGIPTARGRKWEAATVAGILAHTAENET